MSAAASAAAASMDSQKTVWARIRLADRRDVPHVHRLIRQMAEFELLTHLFSATETLLSATLFPDTHPAPPPFRSFTVLILELSPTSQSNEDDPNASAFPPIVRRIDLKEEVPDPEAGEFGSPRGGGRVVAGFLLCFPNYSTFLARPGMYVEDIFVRAPWRRHGLGRMMLSAVARQAARMGFGRVEWCVLDWNTNAIKFYEEMGAEVLPQWRICRLTGLPLEAYAADQEVDKNHDN